MPGHPCVRIDDADAMRQATEHLISQGHRRIAYIGAVPPRYVKSGTIVMVR